MKPQTSIKSDERCVWLKNKALSAFLIELNVIYKIGIVLYSLRCESSFKAVKLSGKGLLKSQKTKLSYCFPLWPGIVMPSIGFAFSLLSVKLWPALWYRVSVLEFKVDMLENVASINCMCTLRYQISTVLATCSSLEPASSGH